MVGGSLAPRTGTGTGFMRRVIATSSSVLTAVALSIAMPHPATAAAREPAVTAADAAAERAPVQSTARALVESGNAVDAGTTLDRAASVYGDPILYMDAADAYFQAGEDAQDVALVDAGAERAFIALDILYFQLDPSSDDRLRMVDNADVPDLIMRAKDQLERAEALVTEIEQGPVETEVVAEDDAKRSKRKPARLMFISGAATAALGGALTVMGVAGLATGAVRQNKAEDPAVYGDAYDELAAKGKRANILAGVGLGIGLAMVGAGAALVILGKREAKKSAADDKLVRMGPTFDRHGGGVRVSGRF